MGLHWQFGVVQGGSSSPLAVSISSNNSPTNVVITTSGPGTSGTSSAGAIDYTATPSGGTAPYTYAWVLSEQVDPNSAFTINTQGTTNAAQYNTGRITGAFPGPPNPPAGNATYRVVCTVSDSASGSVTAQDDFVVIIA
jgi:hypothetical protein